jgi:hypothetical protein
MAIYKRTVTKKGKENFFKDGKHVKRHLVPFDLLEMEPGVETEYNEETNKVVTPAPAAPEPTKTEGSAYDPEAKLSVISGEPGTRRKWLNQKVYWLTDEEYNNYNLGKLAQHIRENNIV